MLLYDFPTYHAFRYCAVFQVYFAKKSFANLANLLVLHKPFLHKNASNHYSSISIPHTHFTNILSYEVNCNTVLNDSIKHPTLYTVTLNAALVDASLIYTSK